MLTGNYKVMAEKSSAVPHFSPKNPAKNGLELTRVSEVR
jgi:hypothetical protein